MMNLTSEDYAKMVDYMKKILIETNGDKGKNHTFRSRIKHTLRVLKWAERLTENENISIDKEILYTAVIFHDTGYGLEHSRKHGIKSAEIFMEYSKQNNFPEEFAKKVEHCIQIHSNKDLMETSEKLSNEELLLMEADMLDEEGAISIIWDGIEVGSGLEADFEVAYDHILKTYMKRKGINTMVTPAAKKYWQDKMDYLEKYVEILGHDLEYGECYR